MTLEHRRAQTSCAPQDEDEAQRSSALIRAFAAVTRRSDARIHFLYGYLNLDSSDPRDRYGFDRTILRNTPKCLLQMFFPNLAVDAPHVVQANPCQLVLPRILTVSCH